MHRDFLTALQHGENIDAVFQRLRQYEFRVHEGILYSYEEDKRICDYVKFALRQPEGSFPHEWAQTFIKQAEAAEAKKPKKQLRTEARRREIENEYLELKQKEIEAMKYEQRHSDR